MYNEHIHVPDWLPAYLQPHVPHFFDGQIRLYGVYRTKGREATYRLLVATGTNVIRVERTYGLRGSLFCFSCNARLSDGFSKGRSNHYHYFFCLGRQTHRNGCLEPYSPADDLEQQVEAVWWRVEIPRWLKERIKADAAREIPERLGEAERGFAAAQRRLDELMKQRKRLMDGYMAEAVPLDLLKEEQDRIGGEIRALEATAPPKARAERVERMLDRAFHYGDQIRDVYFSARPHERRAWNLLVFRGFWVGDRQVRRSEFQDLVEYEDDGSSINRLVAPAGFGPALTILFASGSDDERDVLPGVPAGLAARRRSPA